MVEFVNENGEVIKSQFTNALLQVNDFVIINGVTKIITSVIYDADNAKRIICVR